MKQIIYLSLAAILLITGCQGSKSFLKQKYTRYGHVSNKTAVKNTHRSTHVNHSQAAAGEGRAYAASLPIHQEPGVAFGSEPTTPQPISVEPRAQKKNISGSNFSLKHLVQKNGTRAIKNIGKRSDTKTSAAKGIIGTTLEIILFIIILAIVVVVGVVLLAIL